MDRHKHTPNMTPKSCKTEVKHTNNPGEVCTKTDPTITEAGLKSLQNDKGYSTMTTMAAIAIPPIMRACP